MSRRGAVLAATLCCIGLGACRGGESTEPPAAKAGAPADTRAPSAGSYTIRHRLHPSLPDFAFTLIGEGPAGSGETARVQRIEIRRATATEPFQVIDGLDTETPLAAGVPQLDVLDMNFDGYGDMRIVQFRPAGPNTPYLNWLFDPASGKFDASRELNEIPSPEFDPGRREIRSSWRDGATRYGTDVYVFSQGRPVLVRKEEKTYRAPGIYALEVSQLTDGAWRTIEQREVREEGAGGADKRSTPAK